MNVADTVRVRYPQILRDLTGGDTQVAALLRRLGLARGDGLAGSAELLTKTYQQIDGIVVRFSLDRDGAVRMKANLADHSSNSAEVGLDLGSSGTLTLWSVIPETLLIAAVGRELGSVVSHRWFRNGSPIISSTWSGNGLVRIGFNTPMTELGSAAYADNAE